LTFVTSGWQQQPIENKKLIAKLNEQRQVFSRMILKNNYDNGNLLALKNKTIQSVSVTRNNNFVQ
jgi:hypothetical protein